MKATKHYVPPAPPRPPEYTVTLELNQDEASALFRLSLLDVTIPSAIGDVRPDAEVLEAEQLLDALSNGLRDAGVTS